MPGLMLGLFIVLSEDDDEAATAAIGCGDESPHLRAEAAEEKDAVE